MDVKITKQPGRLVLTSNGDIVVQDWWMTEVSDPKSWDVKSDPIESEIDHDA